MRYRQQNQRRQHFTLFEVMVVLMIIGMIAAMGGPAVFNRLAVARQRTAQTQVTLLHQAVRDYYLDMDAYPSSLRALVENPGNSKWNGPYLDPPRVPRDPWNNEFHYAYPGQHGDFDIVCYGADGVAGGDGANADFGNWQR